MQAVVFTGMEMRELAADEEGLWRPAGCRPIEEEGPGPRDGDQRRPFAHPGEREHALRQATTNAFTGRLLVNLGMRQTRCRRWSRSLPDG
jgi:hypothetical protein